MGDFGREESNAELFQKRVATELADTDMDGNAGADIARRLELRKRLFRRASESRQIERNQLIVARQTSLAKAANVIRRMIEAAANGDGRRRARTRRARRM